MNRSKAHSVVIPFLVGTVLFLVSCLCNSSSFVPTPLPTRTDILPAVGDWVAPVEWGQIKFTVRETGEISYWEFVHDTSPCTLKPGLRVYVPKMIEGKSFSIKFLNAPSWGSNRVDIHFEGTFADDFSSASGTWKIRECAGTWQAFKQQ